ncbi:hypothetical protein PanWU01x14_057100 [Parasponia andersonii]|uniref:Uncharacterized protein n=1 Tax=Parasponia andersonii TaxID=3476 RepID=A0A2P5DJR9_PARAD|nr:hypothetical protein PanWU01x14_057100 [Parasponia andersonii]
MCFLDQDNNIIVLDPNHQAYRSLQCRRRD